MLENYHVHLKSDLLNKRLSFYNPNVSDLQELTLLPRRCASIISHTFAKSLRFGKVRKVSTSKVLEWQTGTVSQRKQLSAGYGSYRNNQSSWRNACERRGWNGGDANLSVYSTGSRIGADCEKESLSRTSSKAKTVITAFPYVLAPIILLNINAGTAEAAVLPVSLEQIIQNASIELDVLRFIAQFNPRVETLESIKQFVGQLLQPLSDKLEPLDYLQGGRWLAVLLALPVWWQIQRTLQSGQQKTSSPARLAASSMSKGKEAEARLRAQRVRRELQRLELKSALFGLLKSLGPAALQPQQGRTDINRREVENLLVRLQEVNPQDDPFSQQDIFTGPDNASANDAFVEIQIGPELSGDWLLIYASDKAFQSQDDRPFPQLPGMDVKDIRQVVKPHSADSSLTSVLGTAELSAQNSAEVKLGPLGSFSVSVEGKWRTGKASQAALVSFDSFSVRALSLLGSPVSEDLPALTLNLPKAVQQSAEWETLYVDDDIRLNRGEGGNIYLFKRMSPL